MRCLWPPDSRVWEVPDKLVIQNTTADVVARLQTDAEPIPLEELPKRVDLVFNALLGKYGEDGAFQGVLELLDLPYTGSGVLASTVGMDKRIHKALLRSEGIPVAEDVVIERSAWTTDPERWLTQVKEALRYPVVVKPTREGSSIGVSTAGDRETLTRAIEGAFSWDREILVEEYLEGIEFMCVVLGNDAPEAMLPTEVSFAGELHTYESKYMPGRAQYHTPARVPEPVLHKIQEMAVRVYQLIGCKGYGRVDGFVVGETIYISEPHTGTIMVPSSYVFHQAARHKVPTKGGDGSKGLSPRDLITQIIELAAEAHRGKKGAL